MAVLDAIAGAFTKVLTTHDMRRKPVKGDRLSFAAIAAKVNEDKVPTRSDAPWRPSVIGQILDRE